VIPVFGRHISQNLIKWLLDFSQLTPRFGETVLDPSLDQRKGREVTRLRRGSCMLEGGGCSTFLLRPTSRPGVCRTRTKRGRSGHPASAARTDHAAKHGARTSVPASRPGSSRRCTHLVIGGRRSERRPGPPFVGGMMTHRRRGTTFAGPFVAKDKTIEYSFRRQVPIERAGGSVVLTIPPSHRSRIRKALGRVSCAGKRAGRNRRSPDPMTARSPDRNIGVTLKREVTTGGLPHQQE